MNAREYLNTVPGATDCFNKLGEEYGADITSEIVDMLREYHQLKSNKEAEKRYQKAVKFLNGRGYITRQERLDRIDEALLIASGKKK